MNSSHAPGRFPAWLIAFAVTALGYAVVGRLAMLLAIPPGNASPLYPSAGIALAAVLIYGPRMVPAVMIGSLAGSLGFQGMQGLSMATGIVMVVAAVGAGLQAWVGAALVQRFVHRPLTLSEPRDIGLFFVLGAAVACLLNASMSTAALSLLGVVPAPALLFTWATWWMGDAMGALIGAPIVLAFFAQPRDDWAHRRWNVGLTLVLATALVASLVSLVTSWNEERLRNSFEREALNASSLLSAQLLEPLRAVEALHSVFVASDEVTRKQMNLASRSWFQSPSRLQAFGFAQAVRRSEIDDFVNRVRADGLPEFGVRPYPYGAVSAPAGTGSVAEAMPIVYIEPEAGNASALGVDSMTSSVTRAAIEQTVRTGRAVSSSAFVLSQSFRNDPRLGLAVYRAIYAGTPATQDERIAAARGVVFVSLDVDRALRPLFDQVPEPIAVCLIDTAPSPGAPRRLYGAEGCETAKADRVQVRAIDFAGRPLELRLTASHAALSINNGMDAWLFSLVGLAAAGLMGAMLLAVTGRTRRIEVAVGERTAALEQQVRERESAEAALNDTEQRFRNVFDVMPLGLIYVDVSGHIRQVNPRFCELVGYTFEELQTLNGTDITHPDDRAEGKLLTISLLRGEVASYTRQKRYVKKSGEVIWVRTVVSALRGPDGRTRFIVSVVDDITEHLRLEESARAREAAEASNRAKSDFLSRMSHELRTPLNAMLGFAQLLELDQRHPLADLQRPWVAQIQKAGWHLLDMINDVLDLSRIESGTLRLAAETLDLPVVLGGTLPLVEGPANKSQVTITQQVGPNARFVRADATRVKQILTNLLSNAVKYNVTGGRIHVSSHRDGDMTEIVVADTGLGMTPAQMSELFEPFNRLGRERTQLEGTGIGLVISQRLASLMGGSLRATSTSGQGSLFILSLPAVEDADAPPSQHDSLVAAATDYHQRLVHYVEDNETNVEVMRGIVAQRPQVHMDVSVTGLDGLENIRRQRPDLILLDMHLPDISGLELLRHLKNDPATAGIPVVSVSADALDTQIRAALDAGALRYLTKPVSVIELLAVLDESLASAETRFG